MRAAKTALPVALVAVAAGAALALFAASRHDDHETLSAPEGARLARFERNVRVSLSLDDRLTGPTYGQLLASSDAAIGLVRAKPDAIYPSSSEATRQTVRQVLANAAFTLAPYAPDLTAKLVRAVEASP